MIGTKIAKLQNYTHSDAIYGGDIIRCRHQFTRNLDYIIRRHDHLIFFPLNLSHEDWRLNMQNAKIFILVYRQNIMLLLYDDSLNFL